MEGKLTREFRHIVKRQMIWADGHYTVGDWTRHLISRVLDMTHGQWLYRNAVIHERMEDGLTRNEQEALLLKMENQFEQGEDGLSQDDTFLLEFDFESLWSKSGRQKKYWLQAIESARAVERNMSNWYDEEPDSDDDYFVRPRSRRRLNASTKRASPTRRRARKRQTTLDTLMRRQRRRQESNELTSVDI